ncbi:MAG: hypothetical protein AAF485_06895 [Chloroflexota bacterium]
MMMEMVQFLGLDCLQLKNNTLELLITQSVGPRILSLRLQDGENLFAELPDMQLEHPEGGVLNLWGGHRLWHAPEVKRRTYLPDNDTLTVVEIDRGVEVVQPTEIKTGIKKSLRVTLPDETGRVIIDHTLKNEGAWPVTLAPWAITQLKPGGFGILPQPTNLADPDGVLANRRLAIWPYTDMNSPHIQWGNKFIFVDATMTGDQALKLGFPNPIGWLAYYIDQTVFIKESNYDPQAEYFDFGSSSECYCRPEFIELETLGPKVTLAPDEAVTHRETWQVIDKVKLEMNDMSAENYFIQLQNN